MATSSDDSSVTLCRSRHVAEKLDTTLSSSSSVSHVSRLECSKDTLTSEESSGDIQSPASVIVTGTRPGDTPPPPKMKVRQSNFA